MAEHKSNDHHSASTIEVLVSALRLKLSDAGDSSWKAYYDKKLDEILDWVKELKKKERDKTQQIPVEDVGKVLTATINAMEKFKSEDPLEITSGVLGIISSSGDLIGKPSGPVVKALCSIISAILTLSKPQKLSVVDQLAKIVHDELVHFNKRLQDQKYDGLKRRVSDQKSQLWDMKPGEKLDDPNLWNDYVQFMGELSNRFETKLPFKYEDNLTKDPDVADFVTAVVTYCEAYCCFMALLVAAKVKFAELGSAYKEDEDAVDRKISCQKENGIQKLSFLSEERYLTFLGRLPYEGGKLTKIVVLSRNMRGKCQVEAVRGSLGLPGMQNSAAVEDAAAKVARQLVKVKVNRHQVLPEDLLKWIFVSAFGPLYWVQFVNETAFPMKIVSGRVGCFKGKLRFVEDVQPRASYHQPALKTFRGRHDFSTGGYIIL